MITIVERFKKIKLKINSLKPIKPVNIIAVSKTFPIDYIKPLIDYGHTHFGENKVQEATAKWTEIRKSNQNLRLHMIGKLQSNKAKDAVKLFDYIHSVDNQKLADTLAKHQINLNRNLKYFIQVNIGNEIQKSGIKLDELKNLVDECNKVNLDVMGLMCLPPENEDASKYFSLIKNKNEEFNFSDLSIGMSSDYMDAIIYKTSFLRIGTKIFGDRD